MDHETFRQQWLENASQFCSQVVIADEADLLLTRDISHRRVSAWPRRFVLLSAFERSNWSGIQTLSFEASPGKTARYLDANPVFPQALPAGNVIKPKLLPDEPRKILHLAVSQSKRNPVLFWGSSKVYMDLKEWPSDDILIPVAVSI